MNREERALALEVATLKFMTDNNPAEIIHRNTLAVTIRHGGMARDQVRIHVLACICTFGLWLPVFWLRAMIDAPRATLLYVENDGSIVEMEIAQL